MDKKKFEVLIYALTKHAARDSFDDFLERWGLTWDDYKEIRDYLKETYGVETYLQGKIAADRMEAILRLKRRLAEESQYMN